MTSGPTAFAHQGRAAGPRNDRAHFHKNLKRIRYADKDPRVNEQIDEIEEMTSRQIEVLRKITNEKILKLQRATNCLRRDQAGQVYVP